MPSPEAEPIGLLVGAGFSKWAADLPLAAELFDFNVKPHNQRDAKKLRFIADLKRSWDEQNPGGLSEQFVSDATRSSRPERESVTWYITRRLSDPFIGTMLGGTQTLMIDDRRKLRHEGIRTAQGFLAQFSTTMMSGAVTTNYDLLIEYALGTGGFNYGVPKQEFKGRGKNPWFPWQGTPVTMTGTLRLAKLHGSLSWDDKHCYTDGRCGVRGDALVLPPGPEKAPPRTLRSTWKLAESILADCRHLLIFGFAFNPYDEAVLDLLATAGSNLRTVLLVDTSPKTALGRRLWPRASILDCQPPPEGQPVIEAWKNHRIPHARRA